MILRLRRWLTYTTKVRPARKLTDAIKRRFVNGLPGSPQDYDLDHLIPIGLGGHPTSPKNLLALGLAGGRDEGPGRAPAAS